MRTLVVGDVHGCLDELLALLAAAGRTPDDRVVLVGDLVAKGPNSAGVVRWARESKADAVLGNHDAHVLRAVHDEGHVGAMHRAVAESLSAADVAWLESRPLFLRLDAVGDRPYLVVHGGLVPGIPIEEQTRDHLLNLRSIKDNGEPSKRIVGAPWASLWKGPEHVVFGHDADPRAASAPVRDGPRHRLRLWSRVDRAGVAANRARVRSGGPRLRADEVGRQKKTADPRGGPAVVG